MKITDIPVSKIVYTTKQIVELQEPILYFTYDEDEDIQIIGETPASMENAMMISFSQALKIDSSILNIEAIQIDETFIKSDKNTGWVLA